MVFGGNWEVVFINDEEKLIILIIKFYLIYYDCKMYSLIFK